VHKKATEFHKDRSVSGACICTPRAPT